MKRLLIITVVSLLLLNNGCSDNSNKSYRVKSIPIGDLRVKIPATYVVGTDLNIERFGISNQIENTKALRQHYKEYTKDYEFKFYVDSNSIDNRIIVNAGPYIYFRKTDAQVFLGMIEKQMESQWKNTNNEFERIESAYKKVGLSQYLKVKYRLSDGQLETFMTNYLISKNAQTISVVVIHQQGDDLQELISKIK